jgi:transposase
MLDEIIITETPPLYGCYSHIGEQKRILITGNHARRVLHGALNIWTGDVLLMISQRWTQDTHQYFLHQIRRHWRGWQLVLIEDRGKPHTAQDSTDLATSLGIGLRFLPRATPELNAMDHLWRHTKSEVLANCSTVSIQTSAVQLCQHILDLCPQQRLQKAGVLSGNFWLAR